jgi:ABC-type Fe3+ transport system substrate-binding protein
MSRRTALAAGIAFALAAGGAVQAEADTMQDLAAKAAGEEGITWYESSQEDQAAQVIEAFNETYPDVEVTHVRVVGGNQLPGRVVQETQAQGYTADVVTGGATHVWQLNDRGLLMTVDWQELGIPEAMTPTDFTVGTAASVYVVLYNTEAVSDEEAPKSWEEVVDSKWNGRMGSWVRATAFAQLAEKWGEEKAQQMLEEYIALEPLLFKSTYPLAQQTAAGEVDVAVGFYHTAQPPIQAGAPLKVVALDPTPMHTIYTSITRDAPSPNSAKLFLAWLASPEGAKAYEDATNRGSHILEGTKTAELLEGKTIAEWAPEKTERFAEIQTEFNEMLSQVGEAR